MLSGNLKVALTAIKRSKWRSLMTMFGVIVGIVSVVTTVSLGEGVKHQVAGQISGFGSDLITIRPGKIVNRDIHGHIKSVNVLTSLTANTLTEQDLNVIGQTHGVQLRVPFGLVSGLAEADRYQFPTASIIATTPEATQVINQKIEFGSFFGDSDVNKHVVVIGPDVAHVLFQENVPVGRILKIRGQEFVVRGIFEAGSSSPFSLTTDFNKAIMMPYEVAKELSSNTPQLTQVLVRAESTSDMPAVVNRLTHNLKAAHGGQEDFTVLLPNESLEATSSILNLLTGLVAGIASISLFVGGIGIMNIMLVSVTERTREIGIRKAIGATNRQILSQFLTEAVVLGLTGGILGILLSFLVNYLLRIFTNLQPVVTLPILGIATLVSIVVGLIFGVIPALKAAHKDPIESLRYE